MSVGIEIDIGDPMQVNGTWHFSGTGDYTIRHVYIKIYVCSNSSSSSASSGSSSSYDAQANPWEDGVPPKDGTVEVVNDHNWYYDSNYSTNSNTALNIGDTCLIHVWLVYAGQKGFAYQCVTKTLGSSSSSSSSSLSSVSSGSSSPSGTSSSSSSSQSSMSSSSGSSSSAGSP